MSRAREVDPRPGPARSSTLRTALVAALVTWVPGAVLLTLNHRELTRHLLEESETQLQELTEELLWDARERRALSGTELVSAAEDSELLEEAEICFRVDSVDAKTVYSSFSEVSAIRALDGRFTIVRAVTGVPFGEASGESDSTEAWCLMEQRPLADGAG